MGLAGGAAAVGKFSEVEGRGTTLFMVADRLYGKIELALFCRVLVPPEDTLTDNNSSGIGYKIKRLVLFFIYIYIFYPLTLL